MYNEDKTQLVKSHLTLKGRNIPFINNVKYLGVNFDGKITCRNSRCQGLSNIYQNLPPFKCEHLSANTQLIFYKGLIRCVMTYAYPTWELVVDSHI